MKEVTWIVRSRHRARFDNFKTKACWETWAIIGGSKFWVVFARRQGCAWTRVLVVSRELSRQSDTRNSSQDTMATTQRRLLGRPAHTSGPTYLAYTPDGTKLVTVGSNNTTRVYKTGSDGEPTNIDDCPEQNMGVDAAVSGEKDLLLHLLILFRMTSS